MPADAVVRLRRCVVAEAVGTALLVAIVVGSGIFARRLSPNDDGWRSSRIRRRRRWG